MNSYRFRDQAALCCGFRFSSPFFPALHPAFGQSQPAAGTPARTSNTAQYNQAINDFNSATRTSDPAKTSTAITELQAVAKTPQYQNDPTVHNLLGLSVSDTV